MTARTVPERDDPNREKMTFLGIDMSTPCLKTSLMNSIGSGMLVGVAYNLATSKNPFKLVAGTNTLVLFGSWFVCRFNYHRKRLRMKKVQPLLSEYALLDTMERAKLDVQWASSSTIRQTNVRNVRSDAEQPDDLK